MKLCSTPKPFTISSSACFRQKRDRERQRNGTVLGNWYSFILFTY